MVASARVAYLARRGAEYGVNTGVLVTTSRVSGDIGVISSGLRNAPPDIAGLDTITALDNASIMKLDRVPEHLIVIGAGL